MDINRKIDAEKYSAAELPAYPARVLIAHVGMKGLQVGSTAGLFIGVPLISYLRKIPVGVSWTRVMMASPVVGSVATLSLLYAKHYNTPMDEDGVDDRAFRIMNNKGQVQADRYSIIGASVGAAFGAVALAGVQKIVASSATGLALGFLYQAAEHHGLISQAVDLKKSFLKEEA